MGTFKRSYGTNQQPTINNNQERMENTMTIQNTFAIGTFKFDDRKNTIKADNKEFAMPRNIIDTDKFASQFRVLYWDAEYATLVEKYNNLLNQYNKLVEQFKKGEYKGTVDQFETDKQELIDAMTHNQLVSDRYKELIGKSSENVTKCHRFVKACVYAVNPNMRKRDGKPVYFGNNGLGTVSVIGDIADGTKSIRDGKKELVSYLETQLFIDGTDSFVKGANIRLTDEQIQELVNAYKGVLDQWSKKGINLKRTTKAELNAQLILKCLKKTFKFKESANSYYC